MGSDTIPRRRFLEALGALALAGAANRAASGVPEARAEGEGSPLRVRRWAMVIDTRRCDGCTSLGVPPQCTQYCIWGRFVPEGQQWLEVFAAEQRFAEAGVRFLAAPCMQCQNAPCANVCPVGATFHTPEGVVLIDQERCIGCRLCMAACPYDRRFFNWEEPVQPASVKSRPYSVQTQTPAIKGTVMKCDFCTDRAEAGGLPYCVDGCPHGALYFGDLEEDIATNGRKIVQLSRFLEENQAFRYKEELGTEPRVYYIAGPTESPAAETNHEREFLKERLEWPWRRIAAAVDGAAPVVQVRSTEGST